jgi:hypothetical protein
MYKKKEGYYAISCERQGLPLRDIIMLRATAKRSWFR